MKDYTFDWRTFAYLIICVVLTPIVFITMWNEKITDKWYKFDKWLKKRIKA